MKPIEQLVMSGCSAETEYLCWLALYEELSVSCKKQVEDFFTALRADFKEVVQTSDFYVLEGYLAFYADRQQQKLSFLEELNVSDSEAYVLTVQHVQCPYAFFAEDDEEPDTVETNEDFVDSMLELSTLEMEYLKHALKEKFSDIEARDAEEWNQFMHNVNTVQEAKFYDDLHHIELLEYLDRQLSLVKREKDFLTSLPAS